ncbi:hypothetical protein AKJ64_01995 [candidate division MSBL1 archaeon SCGC-AAA259E17]|uniref:Translation initiation factor 5A C-terminal domain-containing protein n=1 Tax=candidate division MSBL1 archaeon SCGC-AAA259E17 TaxID=1698263 RepID=A0A133UF68_9EURY|nr:hypothetical protein AKJ64_01995 [candidate division MSBL1 archaeon SCGC-AAA259E17]
MGREMAKIGELDKGSYVVYNGEPCRVTKKSVPSVKNKEDAKEKVYLEGLFDGQKRTFVEEPESRIEVPVIEKGKAQILAIVGNHAQLMDLSSYESFQLAIPLELRGEVEEGDEVEYIQALGRKKIERKRS